MGAGSGSTGEWNQSGGRVGGGQGKPVTKARRALPPALLRLPLNDPVIFGSGRGRTVLLLAFDLPPALKPDPRPFGHSRGFRLLTVNLEEVLVFGGCWLDRSCRERLHPVAAVAEDSEFLRRKDVSAAGEDKRRAFPKGEFRCLKLATPPLRPKKKAGLSPSLSRFSPSCWRWRKRARKTPSISRRRKISNPPNSSISTRPNAFARRSWRRPQPRSRRKGAR